MLDVYAKSFMIASRTGQVHNFNEPSVPHEKRLNWLSRREALATNRGSK